MSRFIRLFIGGLIVIFVINYFLPSPSGETTMSSKTKSTAPGPHQPNPSGLQRPAPTREGKRGVQLPPPPQGPSASNESLNQYRSEGRQVPALPGYDMMKLRAVAKDKYRPELGTQVGEKFGFTIYAADGPVGLTTDAGLPVVAKNSNGILGIVTGTLIVTLREGSLALELAKDYGLKLIYVDEDLRLAYYSAPPQSPLDAVVESLKRDRLVESVNLEVLQSRKKF